MNKHLNKMFSVVTILALMLMGLPMQSVGAAPFFFDNPTSTVFINEIHYDNAGTDSGEAVEIAGPAGTDLTGWSLVRYNGSGGAIYTTPTANPAGSDVLSGAIPDLGDGFGVVVVNYLVNGLQNGNPDGVALVDNGGAVIQFLCYGGTFSAVGGPADGMTCTDIGVSEGSTTPAGNSLQLTGSGTTYGDFTWAAAQANSFGAFNTGQTFGGTTANPKINEFSASTAGNDVEYVEIFGSASTDYSAYTVLEIEGEGAGIGVVDHVIPVGTTDANGFWLQNLVNGDLENGTLTLLLVTNFTGALSNDLDTNNDGTFDVAPWDAIVDTVAVNDGSAGDITYGSPSLGPNYDGLSTFAPGGASRIPDGTDTDSASDWVRNDFDLFGIPGFTGTPQAGEAVNTPGMPNALVSVLPDIVINEVDSDTPGTDALEFVELYDGGDGNTSLDGLAVVFFNGSNDLSYASFDLDGFSTDANGYFVLGNGGVAPDVTFSDGVLQNGADAVALYQGDAADFPANTAVTTTDLIDALVYDTADADDAGLLILLNAGQPQVDEAGGGDSANQSNQRCPNGSGGARNTNTYAQFTPTAGAENTCGAGGPVEAKIHEVQGSGGSVAISGTVIVEAIVVADYQNSDQLSGFFLQEEDADADADANTSEGIFVYCGGCATDVAVGDKVQVTGQAEEFFGMSQIDVTGGGTVTVMSSGNALPTPASVDLPASGSTRSELTFENIEGMLVNFTDSLVVSEYFELARYGQLVLTADARPSQFTDANEPSVPGYAAFLADLNSKRIILDDDNNIQNDAIEVGPDEPYFWPRPGLSNSNFVRGGDSISSLTGVLHWSFAGQSGTDAWRVRPVEPAFSYNFTSNNERTSTPEEVGSSLKVASFNVLNYFTTINSRGADSVAELDRQRAKTAAAICAMDAAVVGLIEIENNAGVAIDDLLNGAGGINAVCGPYEYIDTGVVGTDEIIQAFIYRPASVNPLGDFAVLDSSVDPRFLDDFNRPAIAQTFQDNATGGIFTVVINHLKSKGSDCNAVSDPDILDGQGNCNITRTQAAAALVDWLAADPTGSGDDDFLVMGDMNSYRNEDPIDTIEAGADDTIGTADDFTDLLDALIGPSAYSYVFDGQIGYLDTGFASSGLLGQVAGITEWHINADEIPVFDYNDEIDDGSNESSFERESASLPIYEPNQYRSSDHDPIIVGLDLDLNTMCNGLEATIVGTTGNDVINGTNGTDVIVGLGGNDVINGGNGDDVICGNAGNDTLRGSNGNDTLLGGFGDDLLDGGNGNDTLSGGDGTDSLLGQNGNDILEGGNGNDTLTGHNGDDSLDGGGDNDALVGNNGNDTLTGGTGADSFSGGNGSDTNTDFNAGEGDISDGT
jgi:predicted extracellular nuclease